MVTNLFYFLIALPVLFLLGCQSQPSELSKNKDPGIGKIKIEKRVLSKEFKDYWYAGLAELSSYELHQQRYGEIREGKEVLIFVTEPFLRNEQVKPNTSGANSLSVLKLNHVKNFLTGIYPYSILTSSFYPVAERGHALKVSCSVQEWCGHVYTQLNKRENDYDLVSHSYFEGEADQSFTLSESYLEDEIWQQIRISPSELPQGELLIIPPVEYARLRHKEIRAYQATASLEKGANQSNYTLSYPELNRKMVITFQTAFPHVIEGWEEYSIEVSLGKPQSWARRIKTSKRAYWKENTNQFLSLRDSLGL